MKKIIVLVMSVVMVMMLMAGCSDVEEVTYSELDGTVTAHYYVVDGEKMTEDEYQVWRSEGFWR